MAFDIVIGTDASFVYHLNRGGWCWAASDGRVLCQTVLDMDDLVVTGTLESVAVLDALRSNATLRNHVVTDLQSLTRSLPKVKSNNHFTSTNNTQLRWIAEDISEQLDRSKSAGHPSSVTWVKSHQKERRDEVAYCLNAVSDQISRRMANFSDHANISASYDADRLFRNCPELSEVATEVTILEPITASKLLDDHGLSIKSMSK